MTNSEQVYQEGLQRLQSPDVHPTWIGASASSPRSFRLAAGAEVARSAMRFADATLRPFGLSGGGSAALSEPIAGRSQSADRSRRAGSRARTRASDSGFEGIQGAAASRGYSMPPITTQQHAVDSWGGTWPQQHLQEALAPGSSPNRHPGLATPRHAEAAFAAQPAPAYSSFEAVSGQRHAWAAAEPSAEHGGADASLGRAPDPSGSSRCSERVLQVRHWIRSKGLDHEPLHKLVVHLTGHGVELTEQEQDQLKVSLQR